MQHSQNRDKNFKRLLTSLLRQEKITTIFLLLSVLLDNDGTFCSTVIPE